MEIRYIIDELGRKNPIYIVESEEEYYQATKGTVVQDDNDEYECVNMI